MALNPSFSDVIYSCVGTVSFIIMILSQQKVYSPRDNSTMPMLALNLSKYVSFASVWLCLILKMSKSESMRVATESAFESMPDVDF